MLRLLELKLIKHPIIGDLVLDLTNNIDNKFDSYQTVLIGPNGTGKSYILQSLINIFREAATYLKNNERSRFMRGDFYLKYLYNLRIIEISNYNFSQDTESAALNAPLNFIVDGVVSKDIAFLPVKILASSMIFTDKFPAVSDENLFQYSYLGVRNINSPLSAGTRVINTKVVDSLTTSLSKPGFLRILKKVLVDLTYTPSIRISYIPKYRTVFYGKDLSIGDLTNMFVNWQDAFKGRKSIPWGVNYFSSIKQNEVLLKSIVHFLNTKTFKSYGKGGRYFEYDLLKENINPEEYEVLFHLHKLDLVTFPNIELAKQESKFGIAESSSGEQNILFTLLTLLANVEHNSIIIIDEPELSLHPNWQMQYFSILRDVFKDYKGLHFLVATHSHFLISDIKGENSKIIGLRKDENIIKIVDLPQNINTYGWSAEEILYIIFKVKTTRNFYLEADLRELLYKISIKSQDFERMEQLTEDLKKLNLNENDPLNIIIEKAVEYLYR